MQVFSQSKVESKKGEHSHHLRLTLKVQEVITSLKAKVHLLNYFESNRVPTAHAESKVWQPPGPRTLNA